MVSLLVLVAIPFVGWNLLRAYKLYRNYLSACKLGIPIVLLPISWQDDLWVLTWYWFKWINYLPNFLSWWFDYSRFAWPQELRHHPHEKYGDVFVLVAPGANEIIVNDPQASFEVQAHYKQWLKPEPLYEIFNTFGKGVIAANGDDWQRQRRIINPAFRESVHKLVWDESLKQGRQMLEFRTNRHAGKGTMDDVRKDCVLIALHVLSSAGFGHTHDFSGGLRQVPEGHTTSFSEALMYLLSNIINVFMFTELKPLGWMLPWKAREIKATVAEFREYMKETVAYSRATTQGGGGGQANDIVGALVEGDEAAKREEKIAPNSGFGGKPLHLSDDEMFGNLYVFNLAGFETTANALTYTMPFLARQPDIQDWVAEEIDAVIKTGSEQEWTYETTFPALVRCLAVMYETLRLWGPTPDVGRWPAGDQILRVGDREMVVPAGTYVSTNVYGVNSDPRWWGAESLEWNPKRWINIDPKTGQETIAQPPMGVPFLAWSVGPRICPGKKFSQVEFVAVIATLLKSYRVKPLIIEGKMKTERQARDALLEVVNDSLNIITPKMRRPEDAGVMFISR